HSMAGNCFVGASERDGVRLVSVALKCPENEQKWTDTIRMLNYGYTRYSALTMEQLFAAAGNRIGTLQISNAARSDPEHGMLSLRIARISNPDYSRMIAIDVEGSMESAVADFISRTTMTITHSLTAPVSEGEIMGSLRYVGQSGEIINALLIASRTIKEQPPRMSIEDMFPFLARLNDPLVCALLIVLALLILMLLIASAVRAANRQKERDRVYQLHRRRELMEERAENRRRREMNRMGVDDRDYAYIPDDDDDFGYDNDFGYEDVDDEDVDDDEDKDEDDDYDEYDDVD
ncbi:MAG: hypothetical protein ACSW8J_01490, partial [bacterium]